MTTRFEAFALLVLAATLAPWAQAGPPLLCDRFEIGAAASLPWGEGKGWHSPDPAYEVRRVVQDTLAILVPQTPVIVRMETLRRAAIYSSKDPRLAYELLARIVARTLDAQPGSKAEAMAWFDAGYLVETFRQASFESKQNFAAGLDGYAWTVKAIVLSGGSPEMEYAAALMRSDRGWPNEHFRKALAASKEGSLLSRNLARYKR